MSVLGPGGFAGGVFLSGHADRLAARQLAGERIARDGRDGQRRARRLFVVTAVNGDRDDRQGDQDEPDGAAHCGEVRGLVGHQWNICAEPGW